MNIIIISKGGTLYHVSTLINQSPDYDYTINIVDGQNYSSNPCFPIPFNTTHNIIINFNTSNIGQFNDWYPSECSRYNNDFYGIDNKYIFKGGQSLIFNNLIVDNYSQLSIIQSDEIQCNDCKFINIDHEFPYLHLIQTKLSD